MIHVLNCFNWCVWADVAVGSYLSGEAVLLRAQPVVRFHAHLSTSTERLQPTDRQFRVTACIKYFGKHLPDQMRESERGAWSRRV